MEYPMTKMRTDVIAWLAAVLVGIVGAEVQAQEMTTAKYGNPKLGEETTAKQSLDDPGFKLRVGRPRRPEGRGRSKWRRTTPGPARPPPPAARGWPAGP